MIRDRPRCNPVEILCRLEGRQLYRSVDLVRQEGNFYNDFLDAGFEETDILLN
jgi:hypothetical protein